MEPPIAAVTNTRRLDCVSMSFVHIEKSNLQSSSSSVRVIGTNISFLGLPYILLEFGPNFDWFSFKQVHLTDLVLVSRVAPTLPSNVFCMSHTSCTAEKLFDRQIYRA